LEDVVVVVVVVVAAAAGDDTNDVAHRPNEEASANTAKPDIIANR
jgi:hypothetical protein